MAGLREYHERTKHSVASINANRHTLDWANQPLPFKIYPSLEPLPLPRGATPVRVPALDAIAAIAPREPLCTLPDLATLARVLYLSAGVTHTRRYPGGQEMQFRAAACTGALYHIDLYLVCGELPGLAAGVYHFGPHDLALRRLREGDYRRVLVDATAGAAAIDAAPAVVVCTSTFWRNAWKYQSRAYRHAFWDSGTILANLLAVAAADGVPAHLTVGFVDEAVNSLLGLDPADEAALVLAALGARPDRRAGAPPAQPPLALPVQRLSREQVDYPLIRDAHRASSFATTADVQRWQTAAAAAVREPAPAGDGTRPYHPLVAPPARSIDDVIVRRGSTRRFSRAPITFAQLSTMLACATRGIPADWAPEPNAALAEPYLIVNAADGLAAGTYAATAGGLIPLRAGDLRREAGFLALGQDLGADAAVNVYLLADLRRVLAAFGDRGYRAAQLEAAIVGGKLYLAANTLGLGATGLTFFDDAVVDFFGPHAAGKDVMFLLAAGVPGRRR